MTATTTQREIRSPHNGRVPDVDSPAVRARARASVKVTDGEIKKDGWISSFLASWWAWTTRPCKARALSYGSNPCSRRFAGSRLTPRLPVSNRLRNSASAAPDSRPVSRASVAPIRVRRRTLVGTALRILTGRVRHGPYLYGHDLDRVEISCDHPMPLQADGEDLGDIERAVFEAERDAVAVLV